MGLLKGYFLNSSIHGLHFIADKRFHWVERLFWVICVLGSWGGCLLLMVSAIGQYKSQEISFSVDTSYLHWKTNFPSIVICEKSNDEKMNRLNTQFFPKVPGELQEYVFFDGSDIKYRKFCEIGSIHRDLCLLKNYSAYMHKYRSACSEVIGSCYYNHEQFPCCDEFSLIDTYYGPCFAFNSLLSGKYSSRKNLPFKIIRNVDYGYASLFIELFHTGFRIYGLSPDAVPTKRSSNEYELIGSDEKIERNSYYRTYLSVKPTYADEEIRMMSVENRGCRFYDENNLQHSNIYSLSACENECVVEAQLRKCNCTVHTLPHNDQAKECDFDGLLCTIDNIKEIEKYLKNCSCTSSCFDMKIVDLGFKRSSTKKFNDDRSVVRIDFFVLPPTILYNRSVVKNPLSMLVSVGGLAGLFVGASLLTIVEIIYYFIIRPLGDKYLTKIRNKRLERANEKETDFLYGYHFEFVN